MSAQQLHELHGLHELAGSGSAPPPAPAINPTYSTLESTLLLELSACLMFVDQMRAYAAMYRRGAISDALAQLDQSISDIHAHMITTPEGGEGDVTRAGTPATTTPENREAPNATVADPPTHRHEPDPTYPGGRCRHCFLIPGQRGQW